MQIGHPSAVGFLAFALCLVACVSASAAPKRITVEVIRALKTSKNSTEELCSKTQSYIDATKVVLQRAERFKTKADKVKSEAAQALSQAEAAAKENLKAKDIIAQIKGFSDTVSTLHNKVTEELKTTEGKLNDVLSQATKLKGKCDKVPKTKVPNIKTEVDELDKLSDAAVELMNGVDATANTMTQRWKDAQLANLHVSVIVAFANIGTMMEKADSNIKEIKNKKVEINGVVDEMQTLRQTAPSELNKSINALYKNANDELTKVTGAVEKAKEAEAEVQQQKQIADTAHKNFQAEIKLRSARKRVKKAEACVAKVNEILLELTNALQTAESSVGNVNVWKQSLVTALSATTSAPRSEELKEIEKSDLSVGQDTGPHKKDAMKQPMSEDSLGQSDTIADKLKDALSKGAQNETNIPFTHLKAPAPGAKNDSAMTVSVPLLVALIASAVFQ